MLTFLKKGANVVIKAAITPTTSKLPHQESVGKYLGGMLKSIIPGQKDPAEKHFDLRMHNRTHKLGVELPARTRIDGHEQEVALKVPSYKLPYQTLQKFAAWQEQDKEGEVEETKKDTLTSLINPVSATQEFIRSNTADKYFEKLKALDQQLKEIGGKVTVNSTPGRYKQGLTIELDVSNKSRIAIEKDVRLVLEGLGINDEELVKTFTKRLYKSSTDKKMSSADIHTEKTSSNTDSKDNSNNQDHDIVSPAKRHGSDTVSAVQRQGDDILSSSQEQSSKTGSPTNSTGISNSDFSLTNPQNMPYSRTPMQSSQMLQQLQNQILMQQKPERIFSQAMPTVMQQEIDEIAEDLCQGLNEGPTQGNSNNIGKHFSNPGKVHAR
ncbi:hypothetical protein ECH_0825 [Ehrlichia chaffeensis str. Arkansas]|uniref:Uncharacterized protein n=1 Tax=Ehrlichia chaffeensis (strain ATCC CRL-10679 / Arkansas) TaxID=205920 RepID=Q2GG12_EHRCR|nr:hypothetical protein [Ehrlichia chaffeensis]ABD45044.1 hypothetical protein ECH_0825 [Ehrlichia chaffeensis str. Arkansas]AHX09070.1 hypothetical protein ECHWAK_0316 [Ehrlichia chaffeensis str. Wakulla]